MANTITSGNRFVHCIWMLEYTLTHIFGAEVFAIFLSIFFFHGLIVSDTAVCWQSVWIHFQHSKCCICECMCVCAASSQETIDKTAVCRLLSDFRIIFDQTKTVHGYYQ